LQSFEPVEPLWLQKIPRWLNKVLPENGSTMLISAQKSEIIRRLEIFKSQGVDIVSYKLGSLTMYDTKK
jgi:hypothetical protein